MVMPPASSEWSVWGVWRSHPLGWIWNDPEGPSALQSSDWKYLRLQLLFLPVLPLSVPSRCSFWEHSPANVLHAGLCLWVSPQGILWETFTHTSALGWWIIWGWAANWDQLGKSSCKRRIFSKFQNWWYSTGKNLSWTVEDRGSRSSSVPAHLLSFGKSPQVTWVPQDLCLGYLGEGVALIDLPSSFLALKLWCLWSESQREAGSSASSLLNFKAQNWAHPRRSQGLRTGMSSLSQNWLQSHTTCDLCAT